MPRFPDFSEHGLSIKAIDSIIANCEAQLQRTKLCVDFVCHQVEVHANPKLAWTINEFLARIACSEMDRTILDDHFQEYDRPITIPLSFLCAGTSAGTAMILGQALTIEGHPGINKKVLISLLKKTMDIAKEWQYGDITFSKGVAELYQHLNAGEKLLREKLMDARFFFGHETVDVATTRITGFASFDQWRRAWLQNIIVNMKQTRDMTIEIPDDFKMPTVDLSELDFESLALFVGNAYKYRNHSSPYTFVCNYLGDSFSTKKTEQQISKIMKQSIEAYIDEHFSSSVGEKVLFAWLNSQAGLFHILPFILYENTVIDDTNFYGGCGIINLTLTDHRDALVDQVNEELRLNHLEHETTKNILSFINRSSGRKLREIVGQAMRLYPYNWGDNLYMLRMEWVKQLASQASQCILEQSKEESK